MTVGIYIKKGEAPMKYFSQAKAVKNTYCPHLIDLLFYEASMKESIPTQP